MRTKPWRWLGMLIGIAILLFVLHRLYQDRSTLQVAWAEVSWLGVTASFALFAGAQLLFAFSWHRLLADQGGTSQWNVDLSRWCVTLAGKYVPGKVWQGIARIGLYMDSANRDRVAPAFLRESLLTVSAALALVAVHCAVDGGAPMSLALPVALACLLSLMLATPPLANALGRQLSRLAWFAQGGQGGSYRGLGTVWLLQLAAYLVLGAGFVTLAHALLVLPGGLLLPGTAALCFAGVAGIAAFIVPAGIGVREAALAWYLTPYVGAGPAALLAIAARVWLTLGELAVVALGLWLLRRPATR